MIKTSFINSSMALYNDRDLSWVQELLLTKGYIADQSGNPTFQVVESVVNGHSVIIKAGHLLANFTKGGVTWKVKVYNDTDTTLLVPQNVSGVTKYAHIIVKIDNTIDPNAVTSNVATFVSVPLTTATPTDSDIRAVIGAGQDFYNLGYVTQVDHNTVITNAMITNISTKVTLTGAVDINALTNYLKTIVKSNGAVRSATTIAFVASGSQITDSASGFVTAQFEVGTELIVTGSASNNGTYTILSVSAGTIVVAGTLVNESAGATITLTTKTASKLVETKSDGKIDTTFLPSTLFPLDVQFPAGEALSQWDVCALIDTYQLLGAITLDNYGTITVGGSFTVGANTNRILIVGICVGGATGVPDVASASYNGVAMTNIGNGFISNNGYGQSGKIVMFKLIAPATGANTITFSYTGSLQGAFAYSYYNVDQSTGVEAILGHNNTGFGPWSYTPSGVNRLGVSFIGQMGNSISTTQTQFGGVNTTHPLGGGSAWAGDGTVRSLSTAFNIEHTYSSSGGSLNSWVVHIAGLLIPSNPASVAVVKADATNPARTNTYIGFAKNAYAQNATATIQVHGKTGSLPYGLSTMQTYYVSNTAGQISSSAGSTTKKIGIAISSTEILMKDSI